MNNLIVIICFILNFEQNYFISSLHTFACLSF